MVEQLVQEVPKSALPEEISPQVGMQLQSQSPDGQVMLLLVTEVSGDTLTVDGNHPLAVFSLPASGHDWMYAPRWHRKGHRVTLLASSDYDELERALRLLRVIPMMRQTRILLFPPARGTEPACSPDAVKERLGADVVAIDQKQCFTGMHADYLLPAAGWYEKDDICWSTALVPFSHACTEAVRPVGDSKTDWEFHCLFLKKIQERAKARGVTSFTDRHGEERRLDECYDDFTFQGRFGEENTEDMLQEILDLSTNLGGTSWQELKDKGYTRKEPAA